jgi:hypothetical protein
MWQAEPSLSGEREKRMKHMKLTSRQPEAAQSSIQVKLDFKTSLSTTLVGLGQSSADVFAGLKNLIQPPY